MLKYLFITTAFLILVGCQTPGKKEEIPQRLLSVINYFDSNRIKELDTVKFEKNINGGNNYWRVADSGNISFTYQRSFPDRTNFDYALLVSDSLERIWISNRFVFSRFFPMKIKLPPKNIHMILNQNGLIDIKLSWVNNNYDEQHDVLFSAVEPDSIFISTNPFDYFKARTKTMDSVGIEGISKPTFGNIFIIELKGGKEFLDYLPDNILIVDNYKHTFDSVISKGTRIDRHWVWHKLPAH
ncbi:hypothetical protein [Pinibacter soli]|uniref:Lipoprotein n=1 Tax=Pinibacter soli TaxID=3044211 RepID=A0ABT6RFJ1_9BACT|nr:hypothetical protein [Pinibacter soli]MDI3320654.1 hypothetical protein [Pinibacter soli]